MDQFSDTSQKRATENNLPKTEPAVIDLRSDTVTRPTPEMLEAMVTAPLGDDVYGGDPTVKALEGRTAELLGKEAGLFFPSGTQSNLAALLAHCGRGDEFITGDRFHIFHDEAGGAAVLGSVAAHPLPTDTHGMIDPNAVLAAIKPDDPHYARTRLITLENTCSGRVAPRSRTDAVLAVAREHGLATHLDGARMMNAAVAQGVAPSNLAEGFDSVSLCLSKGLCAPVGTVLCGSRDFINRAYRHRKILGGAMRQSGVLAACGIVALDNNIDRLSDDHANARSLAKGLAALPDLAVDLDAVETNMVFITPRPQDHERLRHFVRERGILIGGQKPTIRLVTHNDVTEADITEVIGHFTAFYDNRP